MPESRQPQTSDRRRRVADEATGKPFGKAAVVGKPAGKAIVAGRAAVAAVLVAVVVAIALLCAREIPTNPIESPGQAFSAPTMYVSPQGTEGTAEGSSGDQSNDSENQGDPDQSIQQSQDFLNQVNTGTGATGGTGGTGGSGDAGSGTGGSGTPGLPTGYGISTNLDEFTAVSTSTRAPNPLGFSYGARSGFDQTNDLLTFYAAPNSMTPQGFSVKVEYSNATTSSSMVEVEGDGPLYSIKLQKADGDVTNVRLTLLTQQGNATECVVNFTIVYNGRKAPTLEVNLTDGQIIETERYDLIVAAADCDGQTIFADNIQVYLDGVLQSDHSSNSPYTYVINVGANMTHDDTPHTVTVTATDYSSEKASTTRTYNIIYRHMPFGAKIGETSVTIDATTVGLGVVDSFQVDIHKGYPYAYDLLTALDERGYSVDSSGPVNISDPESSGWNNFYLARLGGSLFVGQSVPERLWSKIQDDKLNLTGNYDSNSLGEFDYTSVSGWIYAVNGSGRGTTLGFYNPVNGDHIELIFEIAGGKEVGYASVGGGALSTYNAIWRGGQEILQYNLVVYQVVQEATCTATGLARYVDQVEYDYDSDNGTDTISKYGSFTDVQGGSPDGQYITIPMTEHSWQIDWANCIEPTETEDGVKAFVCPICGSTKEEIWPATGSGG